jgi:hypothetical protein
MLAQVAVHAILCEVTPHGGEGALGTWRTQKDTPAGHVGPGNRGQRCGVSSLAVNYVCWGWMCAST